jgi:uncharacterized protein (DUF4415 family)
MKDRYDFSMGTRGAVAKSTGKSRITIMLDDEILDAFRAKAEASGSGYQTEINRALREYLQQDAPPTLEAIRQVIHDELSAIR